MKKNHKLSKNWLSLKLEVDRLKSNEYRRLSKDIDWLAEQAWLRGIQINEISFRKNKVKFWRRDGDIEIDIDKPDIKEIDTDFMTIGVK